MFTGVLGGIGEYFNTDPVIIRLIFILIVLSTAIIPSVLTYLIAIFVIPKEQDII